MRFLTVLALGLALARLALAEPLDLNAAPRLLDISPDGRNAPGGLTFRGALTLTSDDPRFGGLSALWVSPAGDRLVALSDRGHWVTARIHYESGRLAGLSEAAIGALNGAAGKPLVKQRLHDAESLAPLPDGSLLVAFEHAHRIWRYPDAQSLFSENPEALPAPEGLRYHRPNHGVEALAVLADGRILAIGQDARGPGLFNAYLWTGTAWQHRYYRGREDFVPTAATRLPDGDILVMERRFSFLGGIEFQLVRVGVDGLDTWQDIEGERLGALKSPLVFDNYEGLAARQNGRGETLIYLISDDNFSAWQRTLLLAFALNE